MRHRPKAKSVDALPSLAEGGYSPVTARIVSATRLDLHGDKYHVLVTLSHTREHRPVLRVLRSYTK